MEGDAAMPQDLHVQEEISKFKTHATVCLSVHLFMVAVLKKKIALYIVSAISIQFTSLSPLSSLVSYYDLMQFLINEIVFQQPFLFECLWLFSKATCLSMLSAIERDCIVDLKKYRTRFLIIGFVPIFIIQTFYLDINAATEILTWKVTDWYGVLYYVFITIAVMTDIAVLYFSQQLIVLWEAPH